MTLSCQPIASDGGPPVRAERLPLYQPRFDARKEQALAQVLASTHVADDGVKGRELEGLLREASGARAVLALTSCTAALEISVTPRFEALSARAAKDAGQRR